jgi:hypothetical protein
MRARSPGRAPTSHSVVHVAPDEATRYEDYARILAGLQSAATQKLGRAGRAGTKARRAGRERALRLRWCGWYFHVDAPRDCCEGLEYPEREADR